MEILQTKSELQDELKEISSQVLALQNVLQPQIQALQESLTNSSLNDVKLGLDLGKLNTKINSLSSMFTLGQGQTRILKEIRSLLPNSNSTFPAGNTSLVQNTELKTEYLGVTLPFANTSPATIYDGKDSIYLFGGDRYSRDDDDSSKSILRFSISSETLETVGTLPDGSTAGSLQSDSSGNIFLFGGGSGRDEVYKFDPTTNISSSVATLPYSLGDSISIKYGEDSNQVFILGGRDQGRKLGIFDMETFNYSEVSTLPIYVGQSTVFRVEKEAFIFDNTHQTNNRALKFDLDTYDLRAIGPGNLPGFTGAASVWTGQFGYVIGGFNPGNGSHGIYQFNPDSWTNKLIPVAGLEWDNGRYLREAPGSVYVPRLNRIYCFGGEYSQRNWGRREIFVIDLNPLNPTPPKTSSDGGNPDFLSCNNLTNGKI